MKIMCVGDVHWSQNSSIVRSRGAHYSTRLENLLQSVNWAELQAWEKGCKMVVYLGDFFDSAVLNNEEISALKDISWSPLPHIFITGNHETTVSSLAFNSCDLFSLAPNATVLNEPCHYVIEGTDVEVGFLPYILERDRKPLSEYFTLSSTNKRIIFSHNDLKDVQYGQFLSTEGFTVNELEDNCDICMNGHIHSCAYVTNNIINAGNLTGQNFTEDARKYGHYVEVIDTSNMSVEFLLNPYAMNFLKTDVTQCKTDEELYNTLSPACNLMVATIRAKNSQANKIRDYMNSLTDWQCVTYRLVLEPDSVNEILDDTPTLQAVDHLKQFETYVLENIGNTNIIREELSQVMR